MKHTHADRLERWLGAEKVAQISKDYGKFYYPIALHGVPGNVRVMPGGDFTGDIMAGEFMSAQDGAAAVLKKIKRAADARARHNKAMGTLIDMVRAEDSRLLSVGAFASIDAVVAAATAGKSQTLMFMKSGNAANAIGNSNSLWIRSGTPSAGGQASAAPGGTATSASTTGALSFVNLGAANSGHYLNWALSASVANNSLLLYDRIFAVAKTMNSTATEAVTGVPTRYQNTTAGAIDYIGGNFCFPANENINTALGATAHNWTVCTYTDQTGAAGTFQTGTGVSACAISGIDLAVGDWFLDLAAGDNGVKAITQMQCSALISTGNIDFVIGHPIAINACPIANLSCLDDGLYTALNLTPILDNACLSFIELTKPATTATTYSGYVRVVSE